MLIKFTIFQHNISVPSTWGDCCQHFLNRDFSTWPLISEVTLIYHFNISPQNGEAFDVIIVYRVLLFCSIKLNSCFGLYLIVRHKVKERTTWFDSLNISRWMCLVNVEISSKNVRVTWMILAPIAWWKVTSFILLQKTQFVRNISQVKSTNLSNILHFRSSVWYLELPNTGSSNFVMTFIVCV